MSDKDPHHSAQEGKVVVVVKNVEGKDELAVMVPSEQLRYYDPEKPPTVLEFELHKNHANAVDAVNALDNLTGDFDITDLIEAIATAVWNIAKNK